MTTALKFRNITASPDDPVDTWPFEGILAAVERGGAFRDWRRLAAAIRADPWGPGPSKSLKLSVCPALMALPSFWREQSRVPANWPPIRNAKTWHLRSGTLSVDPACPSRISPRG